LLLYYVTDRAQFPGTESQRRERLLKKVAEAAQARADYVQVREKDLIAHELESLSREAAQLVHESGSRTRLLINSRTDIALAIKADGVHLTSQDISPIDVRKIWREAQGPGKPVIAVSCHSEADVIAAESASADFVVFGPVFEKRAVAEISAAGMGLLRKVCRHRVPVIALGGVTTENTQLCIEAGASGVAGIRLFQDNDVAAVVAKLRGLG
jgi:thiamine-phosphate pyrophosphorylase